jgi:NAD-dependent SIR2 family protein deacetylase
MSAESNANSLLSEAALYGIEVARQRLAGRRIAVLTGAGISTDSGIPDYRGAGRTPRHPMTFDTFMAGATAQQRYWARSFIGYQTIASAKPNAGHFALASAEVTGSVTQVVTQNVDGLHQQAGSRRVIELHGSLARVRCMSCFTSLPRDEMHQLLLAANPHFEAPTQVATNADGDVEFEPSSDFVVVACPNCAGVLKPDVVFFGESVPTEKVAASFSAVEHADALLVAGTSLAVNSGLRFARRAAKLGKPVVIVNIGPTKADELANVKIEANTSTVLERLLND